MHRYTGELGTAAYKSEYDQPLAEGMPVELEGGGGTANGHLDECCTVGARGGDATDCSGVGTLPLDSHGRDCRTAVMTGFIATSGGLSGTSVMYLSVPIIYSFCDIGYVVGVARLTVALDMRKSYPITFEFYDIF